MGIGVSDTTSWLPTMPSAMVCWCDVQRLEDRQEPFGVPADQRMIGRVELGRAHAGGEAPQQLVVLGDPGLQFGHESNRHPSRPFQS